MKASTLRWPTDKEREEMEEVCDPNTLIRVMLWISETIRPKHYVKECLMGCKS